MITRHYSIAPVHPGEILREDILPAMSMNETELANALHISRKTLREILSEKQPVTPVIAVQFGELFGNGSRFWVNLQRTYDEETARRPIVDSESPPLPA